MTQPAASGGVRRGSGYPVFSRPGSAVASPGPLASPGVRPRAFSNFLSGPIGLRQAFREVSDGLVAHARFQELLMEQRALVESYREYADLANKRFKGGLESFLTVLDSERQLFSAQLP